MLRVGRSIWCMGPCVVSLYPENRIRRESMADDFIGRKMEEYRARAAAPAVRVPQMSLMRLLLRNRSHRAYDGGFVVREDQLRSIVEVNTRIASVRNRQVLRFRIVRGDEAGVLLPLIPFGDEWDPEALPKAFVVACATVPEDREVDLELGISAQSMLLRATEMGLNGCCIGEFDREGVGRALKLALEPLLLLAFGRAADRVELVRAQEAQGLGGWRDERGRHLPKLSLDELMIG